MFHNGTTFLQTVKLCFKDTSHTLHNKKDVFIPEGKQQINGHVALKYVRMRKEDPLGDFGRQTRQREVISKIIEKGTEFSSLVKYQKILEKNVQTNLKLEQLYVKKESSTEKGFGEKSSRIWRNP